MADIQDILDFWFLPPGHEQHGLHRDEWFTKNAAFDQQITDEFLHCYNRAVDGRLLAWCDSAEGALALVLVLDQFPRNMFRDSPVAFASDAKALEVARHAAAQGYMKFLLPMQRKFLALPFEHSEQLYDQEISLRIFEELGDEIDLEYARQHFDIIKKFARFPHRNAILGRTSTAEEVRFLREPGSSF